MAPAAGSSGDVLRSERLTGGILPKVLNTFDMVAIFVAIVLFITPVESMERIHLHTFRPGVPHKRGVQRFFPYPPLQGSKYKLA